MRHNSTVKILNMLKEKHVLEQWEKDFIDEEIKSATALAYKEGVDDFTDPCGCGQPSCAICN